MLYKKFAVLKSSQKLKILQKILKRDKINPFKLIQKAIEECKLKHVDNRKKNRKSCPIMSNILVMAVPENRGEEITSKENFPEVQIFQTERSTEYQ